MAGGFRRRKPPGKSEALVEIRTWALAGGDVARGEIVFQRSGGCQRCHGSGGRGGAAGPDLVGVGELGAKYVLESLVAPQAQIAENFGSVVVTLKDGTMVSGLLISSDESSVTLGINDGERVSLDRGDIATQTTPTSGMPPMGLVLTPRELRDVVAYAMSVR